MKRGLINSLNVYHRGVIPSVVVAFCSSRRWGLWPHQDAVASFPTTPKPIILFPFASSSLGGVVILLKEKLMLWSSPSFMSSFSSLLALTVLSFLLILKLRGLRLRFTALGFLNCAGDSQSGESLFFIKFLQSVLHRSFQKSSGTGAPLFSCFL